MESLTTLSIGGFEASQVNDIPEKVEYLPAKLGYMHSEVSNVSIKIYAGTILTIMVSVMIFSMTPKVIGPG